MYKVFFNDRIVFIDANLKKSSILDSLCFSVSNTNELAHIWDIFVADKKCRNLYLSFDSLSKIEEIFFPHFKIIKAAGGLVFNNEGQLLCIKRLGKWDLPKGKIEKNESAEQGAIREVIEETGISEVTIIELKEITYHIYKSAYNKNRWILKPTSWYIMKYEGNETLIPQYKEDITEAKWVDKRDLHMVRQQTYASLLGLLNF